MNLVHCCEFVVPLWYSPVASCELRSLNPRSVQLLDCVVDLFPAVISKLNPVRCDSAASDIVMNIKIGEVEFQDLADIDVNIIIQV